MAIWLDANYGIYDSTIGGNIVNTDGALIGRWEDRSINYRHFTQPTVNSRPTLSMSALNGKNVITFDGTDDFLNSEYIRPYSQNTLFIVFRINIAKTQGGLFSESEAGVTDVSIFIPAIQRVAELGSFVDGVSTIRSSKIYQLGSFQIGAFTHDGSQIINYLNGVAGSAYADAFPGVTYNVARGRVGARINAGGSINAPAAVTLGEVIAYDRLLTSSERNQVLTYLSNKWGIIL
jgi:hypothetical protein